jgi:hypothetical protein
MEGPAQVRSDLMSARMSCVRWVQRVFALWMPEGDLKTFMMHLSDASPTCSPARPNTLETFLLVQELPDETEDIGHLELLDFFAGVRGWR